MNEVLRYKICDRAYDEETKEYRVVKVYHLYWNPKTKTININEPIKVSVLRRIKKLLICNDIYYDNIIIGNPDI